jgi:hypothetical protein
VKSILDRIVSFGFWIGVASAAVIPGAMYANWLVACIQLQRRPVPLIEDPKLIGGTASAIYSVTYPLTTFAGWTFVCATGFLILICAWPQQFDRRNAIKKLCVCGGAGLLVFLMFKFDPWRVVEWYAD